MLSSTLGNCYLYYSHFTHKETEAERGNVVCPWSHNFQRSSSFKGSIKWMSWHIYDSFRVGKGINEVRDGIWVYEDL